MLSIKEKDAKFEDFLISRTDAIDNATYTLLRLMQALPEQCDKAEDNVFPWDMGKIGNCEDAVKSFMQDSDIKVCHPYYTDGAETSEYSNPNGLPCYRAGDCDKKGDCPFLKILSEKM